MTGDAAGETPGTLGALVGRRVTGIVPLAPRSLALATIPSPRRYLWVDVDRKEATLAVASDLPVAPDPRGSRFGGLETPVRGLVIVAVTATGDALRLALAPETGAKPSAEIALEAGGKRVNLVLRAADGVVLWALHREDVVSAEAPLAPPPGFHAARIRVVEQDDDRGALRERIARVFREDLDREMKKSLDRAERALARRVEALEGDRGRARERLLDRRKAEILLAHLHEVPRGASRVGLPDPYADSPGSRVEIALDPSLSPHENAARLFRAAKRGERGEERIEARLHTAREGLARVAALRRALPDCPPTEALEALRSFHREAGLPDPTPAFRGRGDQREIRLGRRTAAAPRATRPGGPSGAHHSAGPRTFTTSDGWEVWVGRNNTQNDQITHRLSNPHDFWLHVVGVPGSHVILRRPTRQAVPKPRTLEEAAAIAAWFSKARKQTRVPVIYTERKFVTKPRRGKPGQALCSRERELLVRPRLPEGRTGTDTD